MIPGNMPSGVRDRRWGVSKHVSLRQQLIEHSGCPQRSFVLGLHARQQDGDSPPAQVVDRLGEHGRTSRIQGAEPGQSQDDHLDLVDPSKR